MMTAVSQNLTPVMATAPISPVPDTAHADAVGSSTDASFLRVLNGRDPDVFGVDPPVMTAVPIDATDSATATMPILPEVAEELPVADAAVLSPLAQNFLFAPVPVLSPTAQPETDVAQAEAAEPTQGNTPIQGKAAVAAPPSLPGTAAQLEAQLPVDQQHGATRNDLGANPLAATTGSAPPGIKSGQDSKRIGPNPLAAPNPEAPAPPPDLSPMKNGPQPLHAIPDQPPPVVSNAPDTADAARQAPAAAPTTPPDQSLDTSNGTTPAMTQLAIDGHPAIKSAEQSNFHQTAANIPTSTESAWRQKWIGTSPGASLPGMGRPPLIPVSQGVAGLGSTTADSAAIRQSGGDTPLPGAASKLAQHLPDDAQNAPSVSTDDSLGLSAANKASFEQLSPVAQPAPDVPSFNAFDPAVRATSQDVRGPASQPTLNQTLAPAIVELTKSGNNGPIDIALAPEELGRLTISLRQEGDFVRVSMVAERPETLDLLRRHSGDLLADLRQAGFSGASFSFGQSAQDQARQFTDAAADANDAAVAPPPPPSPDFQKPPASRPSTGVGLDLRL